MSELTDRLRQEDADFTKRSGQRNLTGELCVEAATEIERLERELAEVRKHDVYDPVE